MQKRWPWIAACLALAAGAAPTASALEPEGRGGQAYDLRKAEVFDRVVLAVMEQYYDPERAEPVAMLRGALDALERAVAEVKVDYDAAAGKATVSAAAARMEIRLDAVGAPWGLSRAMHTVFAFLTDELPADGDRDLREIEYAAVNGMLAVLDPHSGAMLPAEWQELRMRLEGEFEGIGIRITTDRRAPCGGDLTVVEVFDDTPAARAGLGVGDKIVRIEGDSTVNITTDEAARRLRGAHGTKVKIQVRRVDGKIEDLVIPRGTIEIKSVKWRMLEGDVGYVSLVEFQQDSADEVADALAQLRDKGMKGLVLDVRGNPGGSLDAAGEIADLFLDSGTIVTTAGRHHDDREVRDAVGKGTEPSYPIVVLVDSYSASAAEVIAGALRNHGRALILGETTFGKGSVQSLVGLPGDGALRLTVAQYLTPGDISIQGVGVAPDVRLQPVFVDRAEMNLEAGGPSFSERDLDAHLIRPSELERTDRPGLVTSPLLIPAEERRADLDAFGRCYDPEPDRLPYKYRRETEVARRIVAAATGSSTAQLILDTRRVLAADDAEQAAAVEKALGKLGVDWAAPPAGAGAAAESDAVVATAKLVGRIEAGRKVRIAVTVRNGAKETIYRLRGVTKSDDPLFDDVEVVFGKLPPGASERWEATVELPPALNGRVDPVVVRFQADAGPVPRPVSFDAAVTASREARLEHALQIEDLGNGDGFAEPGEELAIRVWVTNTGAAPTFDATIQLSGGAGVDVSKGQLPIGRLAPGKTARGEMRLKIAAGYAADAAELKLVVEEWIPGRYSTTRGVLERSFSVPVVAGRPGPLKASGTVSVRGPAAAALLAAPVAGATLVGRAEAGATLPVDGRLGGFFRVVLEPGQHAWIAEPDTRPGGDGAPKFSRATVRPPEVRVDGDPVRRQSGATVRLAGWATHADGVRDVMIFVRGKKVAYVPNRSQPPSARLEFAVDVPVQPGANEVLVVARRDRDTIGSARVFVRTPTE